MWECGKQRNVRIEPPACGSRYRSLRPRFSTTEAQGEAYSCGGGTSANSLCGLRPSTWPSAYATFEPPT